MPTPLSGNNPASHLKAIVESARQHGSGTLLVGNQQVAHRSMWGRLFKQSPVTHQQSIDHFKQILKQTYPRASDKIDALLSASERKGRLTTGAVQRAYEQLHIGHKFQISYPDHAKTRHERMQFEDQRALQMLQDPQIIQTVCDCALKLADHIQKSPQFTDQNAASFLNEHINRQPLYPVHPEARSIPPTKQGLLEFLRSTAQGTEPDRQALLLSMMWMLPKRVAEAQGHRAAAVVDSLYATKVAAGKQHTDFRQVLLGGLSALNKSGAELADKLRADDNFMDQDAVELGRRLQASLGQTLGPGQIPANKDELLGMLHAPSSAADLHQSATKAALVMDLLPKDSPELAKLGPFNMTVLSNLDNPAALNQVMGAVTRPGTFGNTEIASKLMDRFAPHQKESEAVQVKPHPNERVRKFLDAGQPYVSGSSGMANCGSTLFALLDIDMASPEGKRYGEALAAFIVGAGEHSYPEAYKSLNLSLRHLQLGQSIAP